MDGREAFHLRMKETLMLEKHERHKWDKFFKLIQENPDLPILPMVDSEIVEDDYGYWIGGWGDVMIDEYIIAKNHGKKIIFRSDNDIFYTLEQYMSNAEFNNLPKTERECRPYYDKLPWIKAIIVFIDFVRLE